MNKKEFYEAPQWGMRTVRVERQFLQSPSQTSSNSWDDPANDNITWGDGGDNGMD